MININASVNDRDYRYKMHRIQAKFEGKGNGKKTILVNIAEVAKDLRTSPEYIVKFFGYQYGTVAQYSASKCIGMIRGRHPRQKLQRSLQKFITNFILCLKCDLPELQTDVVVISKSKRKRVLRQTCNACSHSEHNSSLLTKVRTYIIKNHTQIPFTTINIDNNNNNNIQIVESNNNSTAEVVWSVDTSVEAVRLRQRQEILPPNTNTNTNTNTNNSSSLSSNPSAILRRFIEHRSVNNADNTNNTNNTDNASGIVSLNSATLTEYDIAHETKRIALAHSLNSQQIIALILDTVCDFESLAAFLLSLTKYTRLLKIFCDGESANNNNNNNNVDNINNVLLLFACIEDIVVNQYPLLLLSRAYTIFQCLYENKLATEEEILQWYNNNDKHKNGDNSVDESSADFRKHVKPFVIWLQDADEESDSDHDQDSDDNDDSDEDS